MDADQEDVKKLRSRAGDKSGGELGVEAGNNVRFMHCVALEQRDRTGRTPRLRILWFVMNCTEMFLNISMTQTGRPDLYFHYLVGIINFC